jgi:hypothetical protein
MLQAFVSFCEVACWRCGGHCWLNSQNNLSLLVNFAMLCFSARFQDIIEVTRDLPEALAECENRGKLDPCSCMMYFAILYFTAPAGHC